MLKEMLSEGSKISSKRCSLVFFSILLATVILSRQYCQTCSIPDTWFQHLVYLTELNVIAVLGDKGVAMIQAWKSNKEISKDV